MSRHFTLDEARQLLPEIDRLIRHAVEAKSEYQEAEQSLDAFKQRIMLAGGMVVDREGPAADRQRRDRAAERLKRSVAEIHQLGCQIKDLDIGLVDFPTLYHDREVLLCWKMGERDIAWWHGMEEGFAGRKPIDDEFLREHRGDEPE